MKIITIRGQNLTSALAAARQRLGDETLVLKSRRLASGQVEVMVSAPRRARPEAGDVLAALLDAGLPDRLAASLSEEAQSMPDAPVPAHERARTVMEKRLSLPLPRREGRQVLALVGPAGVGKTTTWAKLAARDALQRGLRVALITTDTMRIGGVEQARTYAAAMDLPFFIAGDLETARQVVFATDGMDQVYVDTPGLSPAEDQAMTGLSGVLRELKVSGVDLLLPASGETRGLNAAVKRFALLKPARLGFTRLDETMAAGGMLTTALESGLPVAYLSRGPRVPGDLEDVKPGSLLREAWKQESGRSLKMEKKMTHGEDLYA